jgi:carbamoyl-phosphate synthase large subunit
MLNVLLTCAGRRNYLVEYFREALAGRGAVIASDASPDASALQEADRGFLVPPVTDPEYVHVLHDLCAREQVGLLVPLNDLELPVLARSRARFLATGTIPVVASPEVVDLCFDKLATFERLRELGIPAPRTYATLEDARAALSRGELAFPVIVKPRWGTASIGIDVAETADELELACRLGHARLMKTFLAAPSAADPGRAILVQERLPGQEHGLDIVNDLAGNHVATFAKRKLAMRAGETDRAVTVEDASLVALGRALGEALRHVGNLDCDVFVDGARASVLELNPRFGGGYPFSHAAGANLPAALVAWALGETPAPGWLAVRPGVASAKCDRLVPIAARPSVSDTRPLGGLGVHTPAQAEPSARAPAM